MDIEELEKRVRDLEIEVLVSSRIILMLAFHTAIEIGSAEHLKYLGKHLKGMSHTGIKNSDQHAKFIERENQIADQLGGLGEALDPGILDVLRGKKKDKNEEIKKQVEEVFDTYSFEVLPVRTIVDKS